MISSLMEKVENAQVEFLHRFAEPLTEEDEELIGLARHGIERVYRHGLIQLYAVGRGLNGVIYESVQVDAPVGQSSICAESGVFTEALRQGTLIDVLVVAHKKNPFDEQQGEVHLVALCGRCREAGLHVHEEMWSIVPLNGDIKKVPTALLLPLRFKKRLTSSERAAVHVFPT